METDLRQAVPFLLLVEQPWWKEILLYFSKTVCPGWMTIDEWMIQRANEMDKHKEKIRQFQKQKPSDEMFVRPEEPLNTDLKYKRFHAMLDQSYYNKDRQQWQNWEPLFVDENGFKVICKDVEFIKGSTTLDAFICNYKSIANDLLILQWNPEHPQVRELYYPDLNN